MVIINSVDQKNRIDLVNILLVIYSFSIIFFIDDKGIMNISRFIFIVVSIYIIIKKGYIYINKYIIWMIVFTVFCFISVNWSISKSHSIIISRTILINNICFFFIINFLRMNKNGINTIINTIVFSSAALGIRLAIVQGPFIYINGTRGGSGEILNANIIGNISSIAIVLGWYLIINNKNNLVYKIFTTINIISMILSASRKAILFSIIPILIYYLVRERSLLKRFRNTILVIFIIFIIGFIIMKNQYMYSIVGVRFETMINGLLGLGNTDASTSLRMRFIEWGIEWFKEKPYLGYGINSFRYLVGFYKETSFGKSGAYSHNNYIELLCGIGIIGTILYYYIYLNIIKVVILKFKRLEKDQIIMFGILITLLINEYGTVTYYDTYIQLINVIIWSSITLSSKLLIEKGA